MNYANAVLDVPTESDDEEGTCEFCVVKFAEAHFSVDHKLLIVRETGKKPHWHIHGTWTADRKSYKTYFHPDRKGEGRSMTRPVRVSLIVPVLHQKTPTHLVFVHLAGQFVHCLHSRMLF